MAADNKRDGRIRHGRGDSMTGRGRSGGLQAIFSFFLGLMVTAFVGVGAYTFHPPPHEQLARQMQQLDRREVAVRDSRPPEQLTAEDRVQIQMLNSERDQLSDAMQQAREGWARSTSIILITLATLVMAVSLVRSEQLPVVGNGLLLGGLFTMVYGIGWIISTDTSVLRFVVMTVALSITLALGYIRFVRAQASPPVARDQAGVSVGVAELKRRVGDLEARLNAVAEALRHRGER